MRARCLVLAAALALAGAVHGENLFNPRSYNDLAGDKRARRPGDILTMLVYENASATSTARANLARSTDLQAHGAYDLHGPAHKGSAQVSASSGYSGGGTVERSGRLLAQLSVTVEAVAPNGDLFVKGEQRISINGEQQQIRIAGRVRKADIGPDNSVQSTRLADAQLSYVGQGDLADRQRPGFLVRVLTWLGL